MVTKEATDNAPSTQPEAGRRAWYGNALVSGVALLLSGPAVAVFEQVSTDGRPFLPLAYLGILALAVLPLALLVMRRLVRRAFSRPPRDLVRSAFALPRRLAALHFLSWFTIGAGAGLLLHFREQFRPDRSFMIFLACLLAGVGAALVSFVRTPVHLAPWWMELVGEAKGEAARDMTGRMTLKQKLTLVLGGIVFFSSAFGLYSSFALQREIAGYYVGRQSRKIAREVAAWRNAPSLPEHRCRDLARLAPPEGLLIYRDDDLSCVMGGGGRGLDTRRLLKAPPGPLSVPSRNLEGMRVDQPQGELAILFPKPEWTRRVLLASLVFYTLLFLFTAYLAAQVARELTAPIMQLRRQVQWIEQGDFSHPVRPLSSDELGDLSVSVDAMRKGLGQMVETIRSLNLTLEEKVRLRTSELEQANRELTSTLKKLGDTQTRLVHAEKMASLGRLMSGLAHELNNPVNAILNSASPLREEIGRLTARDEGSKELARLARAANVVASGARRTMDLLESLTTFSRPGEAVRKPTDINGAVEATLLLLQHRVEKQGADVKSVLGELTPVVCHPGEINQVLMNLIANALEAVEHLSARGRVEITTLQEEGETLIRVVDNGRGIPPELHERVFEPFHTDRAEGTGLGLAISHQVVAGHGGRIELESAPDAGSTFSVWLPARPMDVDSGQVPR